MFDAIPKTVTTHPLLKQLGFVVGNPFAVTEAEQERNTLSKFFVDVDGFDRVLEARTTIIFAPRGCGKSALRVYVANESAPLKATASRLVVEYTHFERLFPILGQPSLAAENHLQEILRNAVTSLLQSYMPLPRGHWQFTSEHEFKMDLEGRFERARNLPEPARVNLARLLRTFCPDVLATEELYQSISRYFPDIPLHWSPFFQAAQGNVLLQFLQAELGEKMMEHPYAKLLADLHDMPLSATRPDWTGREWLGKFKELAFEAGFNDVLVLVDRIDEIQQTAGQPEAQANLVEALLANLPLMEIPGLFFKFFLSQEAREQLLSRSSLRPDRLTDQAVKIEWSQKNLKELLDGRILYFSDSQVPDLSTICSNSSYEESEGDTPSMVGTWIETDMLALAQGSPRRLLMAGQLLFDAYLARRKEPSTGELVVKDDWLAARSALLQKMPPTLRISRNKQMAWIGLKEIKLTKIQHAMMIALMNHKGVIDLEKLADTVWGTKEGVSDEAITTAISRLRVRLGEDARVPVYIEREGKMIVLHHFVEAE